MTTWGNATISPVSAVRVSAHTVVTVGRPNNTAVVPGGRL